MKYTNYIQKKPRQNYSFRLRKDLVEMCRNKELNLARVFEEAMLFLLKGKYEIKDNM